MEQENDFPQKMKVYRASYYGFDANHFLIAANSEEEAHTIMREDGYGPVSIDDLWECGSEIETTATEPCILEQF